MSIFFYRLSLHACLMDPSACGYTGRGHSHPETPINKMHNKISRISFLFFVAVNSCQLLVPASLIGEENIRQSSIDLKSISLEKINGEVQSFGSLTDKEYLVVVFIGNECPLAKIYLPRIGTLAHQYQDVAEIVGVNSNSQDTVEEIKEFVRRNAVSFPVYKDAQGQLADTLNAKRTPEVFVIQRDGKVLYQGRIDDQYGVGYAREAAGEEYLRNALAQLRQARPISIPRTQPVGCFIGRMQSAINPVGKITYHNKIGAIVQKHCVECHKEGEIGPFALTNYDDVAVWSETIGEVIEQGRMPPWHANPAYGSFSNTRRMSPEEQSAIFQWIKDGCPQGLAEHPLTNAKSISGWQSEKVPDLVLPMREKPFTVPADGTVEYQYFVVDPGFTEDRWVTAAEVVPGNRSVVHHAIVFISAPDQQNLDSYGWLSAYVPGQRLTPLKPGQARKIPAGSRFIFQMHYTPNGSIQEDQTKIGLTFTSPDNVDEEMITLISANRRFKIPPGSDSHRVDSILTEFPQDAKLTALTPHMHLRGKSFRIIHRDKSNNKTILLDVPQYDFNWQHVYRLKTPLSLNSAKQIECTAHFDNSENNVVNPDATSTVRWGDQSWEEMMIAFFEISVPRNRNGHEEQKSEEQKQDKRQHAQANQLAEAWMRKWDHNLDSLVQRDEVSESFRRFAFSKIDRNYDQEISLEETISYISDTLSEEKQQEDIRRQLDQLK